MTPFSRLSNPCCRSSGTWIPHMSDFISSPYLPIQVLDPVALDFTLPSVDRDRAKPPSKYPPARCRRYNSGTALARGCVQRLACELVRSNTSAADGSYRDGRPRRICLPVPSDYGWVDMSARSHGGRSQCTAVRSLRCALGCWLATSGALAFYSQPAFSPEASFGF